MAQNSDLAIVIGGLVTIIGGFYAIARIMLNQASKDRKDDRAERMKLSEAITCMADASKEVAIATVKSANEAEQRNGHLASLVAQGTEVGKKNLIATERLEKKLKVVEKRKK